MAVMCPSQFCRIRVTSPSSQSHPKFFRVVSGSSHGLVESSPGQVTRTVQSLQASGLQTRVNVESYEFSHFSCIFVI